LGEGRGRCGEPLGGVDADERDADGTRVELSNGTACPARPVSMGGEPRPRLVDVDPRDASDGTGHGAGRRGGRSRGPRRRLQVGRSCGCRIHLSGSRGGRGLPSGHNLLEAPEGHRKFAAHPLLEAEEVGEEGGGEGALHAVHDDTPAHERDGRRRCRQRRQGGLRRSVCRLRPLAGRTGSGGSRGGRGSRLPSGMDRCGHRQLLHSALRRRL
jgi:hypothetical protein